MNEKGFLAAMTYRLEVDGNRLVLPATGHRDANVDFSSWKNAQRVLDTFCRETLKNRRALTQHEEKYGVPAEVALVHRPDNDYNPNAISVAMPASFGGTDRSRHMGYLFDHYLRDVGMPLFAELAEHAALKAGRPVEIVCTARVWDDNVVLDLPEGPVLRKAIVELLSADATAETSDGSAPVQIWHRRTERLMPRADRQHTSRKSETTETLAQISSFAGPQQPVHRLAIAVSRPNRGGPRPLRLTDADTGRSVGTVILGYLLLSDERDRQDVLPLLAEAGIEVAQPGDAVVETWPTDQVPNMWTYWFPEGLDLRPRDPATRNSWTTMAYYNPTTKTLWVEDSRLVEPTRIYAARLGLPVARVGLPRVPWRLDSEIPYDELKDPALRPVDRDFDNPVRPHPQALALVPDDLFPPDVPWVAPQAAPRRKETDQQFIHLERFATERSALIGPHDLSETIGRCRLCRQPGLEFTTPICTGTLTYCHGCLTSATNGVVRDRDRAAQALRLLGQVEFDEVPMLEAQLDTLHLNPAVPADPRVIDQLLLLRFAVARRQFPWTLLLEEAGFAEDGLRGARGTLIRARDGHLCLSLREKAVCEFLHQHGIEHDREPLYPPDPMFNASGRRRADWILTDGTLVELWGLPNDPAYAAKMIEKRELAARHALRLVELTDAELPRLPQVFAPWLPNGATTSGWAWTPVTHRSTQARKATRTSLDPADVAAGRNDHNAAERLRRLERCTQAVEAQQAGLSRSEIAELLGVSAELVKALLRDGKFYADPSTDPARLEAAQLAAAAQTSGMTRAQFRDDLELTAPKAAEAWRDSDVLGTGLGPTPIR